MSYFIVNCHGDIVGNRYGYANPEEAIQVANRWDVKESCDEALARLKVTKPSAHIAYHIHDYRDIYMSHNIANV